MGAALFEFDPVALMIRVPVVLLALTVHEFSHAYFALLMGDPTAYRQGRCTLNPLMHLDPLGTLCLMFAPIGWAKPVPINPENFRDRRQGILVSVAAGPISNLLQAVLFGLVLRAITHFLKDAAPDSRESQFLEVAWQMAYFAIMINVGLAVFNCLPFYPLDGFNITAQLMRREAQQRFVQMARFGPMLILAVIVIERFTPYRPLTRMILPAVQFVLRHVAGFPT
jgi:Zn-dependent protease